MRFVITKPKSCSLEFFNVIIRILRFGFNYIIITELRIGQIFSKLKLVSLENRIF